MVDALLTKFYNVIVHDDRIRPSHVSLYMALLHCWHLKGSQSPVYIKREQVMRMAKIKGLATYHNGIRQLATYG